LTRSLLLPNLAILLSTLLWGTLWIPLREIRQVADGGAFASTASLLLPLILLLPLALKGRRRILSGGFTLLIAAFFLALAIALYSEGVVRGRVARVILLFYLTPVWSSLLARFLLGEAITAGRVLAIVLGLAGMLVIFGVASGIPLPAAAGEWMGLVAGMAWALAMVYLNRTAALPSFDRVFALFVFLGPIVFLLSLIPGGELSPVVEERTLRDVLPWLLALGLLWMLPVVWLTVMGASRLDPGRVAVFLMLEIAVAMTTAALLAGEPFGAREIVGALLVMSASVVEVAPGLGRPVL